MKKKLTSNLILGIMVGIGAVTLILTQVNIIIAFLVNKKIAFSYRMINYSGILISGMVFILIVRKFARAQTKKLAYYFVLSMVAAAGGAILTWYVIMIGVGTILDANKVERILSTDGGMLIINVLLNYMMEI